MDLRGQKAVSGRRKSGLLFMWSAPRGALVPPSAIKIRKVRPQGKSEIVRSTNISAVS
jgi:hypothetical protein